jgi:hypothetical protein
MANIRAGAVPSVETCFDLSAVPGEWPGGASVVRGVAAVRASAVSAVRGWLVDPELVE